ncbi:hypothetical protein FACS189473_0030 [Spirochaetia bacterium]|nr:hypothetical protein FACS189473_0030 [Spirochaetia bacterium]
MGSLDDLLEDQVKKAAEEQEKALEEKQAEAQVQAAQEEDQKRREVQANARRDADAEAWAARAEAHVSNVLRTAEIRAAMKELQQQQEAQAVPPAEAAQEETQTKQEAQANVRREAEERTSYTLKCSKCGDIIESSEINENCPSCGWITNFIRRTGIAGNGNKKWEDKCRDGENGSAIWWQRCEWDENGNLKWVKEWDEAGIKNGFQDADCIVKGPEAHQRATEDIDRMVQASMDRREQEQRAKKEQARKEQEDRTRRENEQNQLKHRNALARLSTAKSEIRKNRKKSAHFEALSGEFDSIAQVFRSLPGSFDVKAQIEECVNCRKQCKAKLQHKAKAGTGKSKTKKAVFIIAGIVILAVGALYVINKYIGRQQNSEQDATVEVSVTVTVISDSLNFRSGPSSTATVLRVLKKGDILTATGDITGGWAPVEYNGEQGYVSAELVSK